ncbi:MAG: hypothetical protein QOG23_3923 [Blastocatellia bacterium]|jgi:hypothetical protein|nr:hypothetical protein [Blastocatellia bacterium]
MRILDNETGSALDSVTLYFTLPEAEEVIQTIAQLLATAAEHHAHINDHEYKREITIAIYTNENLVEFDERSRRLIEEGI